MLETFQIRKIPHPIRKFVGVSFDFKIDAHPFASLFLVFIDDYDTFLINMERDLCLSGHY